MLAILKTVYDESTMNKSNVFKWHKCFRQGVEDVNNDERQGVPVTMRPNENVVNIWEYV
jgi:phosphoglycerate dehydrogenase-like enzyme